MKPKAAVLAVGQLKELALLMLLELLLGIAMALANWPLLT
jgi:hypothetical protein